MKNKWIALAIAFVLCLGGEVSAKHHALHSQGGYDAEETSPVSVKEALTMPDDSAVTLQGKIVQKIKKDKYLFQDQTGEIVAKIDDDVWNGQTVSPKDTVTISGEVDQDHKHPDKTKIEVDRLVKHDVDKK